MRKYSVILLALLVCVLGCTDGTHGKASSERTMVTKVVAGHTLTMNYLSAESISDRTGVSVDEFEDNHTFTLTLKSDHELTPLYSGLSSLEEFKMRHQELSFDANQYFYVKDGSTERFATHVHIEHDYGLTPSLTYYIIFSDLPSSEEIDIFFNDEHFGLGLNRFRFMNSALNNNA